MMIKSSLKTDDKLADKLIKKKKKNNPSLWQQQPCVAAFISNSVAQHLLEKTSEGEKRTHICLVCLDLLHSFAAI